MKFTYSYLIIYFLLLSNLINAQDKISSDLIKKIDSIFDSYQGNPGCALAIVKEGETLFKKGYGFSNLEYDIPITSHTMFDVSAVAKQFTAACIFLLESEEKLSLNDPIQKFFPEFPEYDQGKLTIKNLVYQTSGIRS